MMKPPAAVNSLIWMALGLSAWNGFRLGNTLYFWKDLEAYGIAPAYLAASGGVWLVVGLCVAAGLRAGRRWAWFAAWGITLGYTTWYWLDRMFLQMPRPNWPFALGVTASLLLLILWMLLARTTRLYLLRKNNERKPKNPTPA